MEGNLANINDLEKTLEDIEGKLDLIQSSLVEFPTFSLPDAIIAEECDSAICSGGMISIDPLYNEGVSVVGSVVQLMGVDPKSLQEDSMAAVSLANKDIGIVGMISVDPLYNKGVSVVESEVQLKGIDPKSLQEDNMATVSLANKDIGNDGMISTDPLYNEGVSVVESGVQLMGIDPKSLQEDNMVTVSLANKDIGIDGMISVDPLYNEGVSVDETSLQLMSIDYIRFREEEEIIGIIKEAADELCKSISIDREKISIKSYTKNFSSSSKITCRQSNFVIVNFINVEGDVYENEINLIS